MKATLYRCSTPTNRLCPCGRIHRMATKQLDTELETVVVGLRESDERRDAVQRLTGQRRVPVLVIDGEAVCDSLRITEWLGWRAQTHAADQPITAIS